MNYNQFNILKKDHKDILLHLQQGEEAMTSITYSNKINPTLMPPQNFRITRRVGSDSLLVAWIPPNDTEVSGYFVRNSSSSNSDLLLTI